MSPQELLQKLTEYGIKMSDRNLRLYTYEYKCAPEPERGRHGTGGQWSDYPEHAVAEMVASWRLMKGKDGVKVHSLGIGTTREKALSIMGELENPSKPTFFFAQWEDWIRSAEVSCVCNYYKVIEGLPLEKPIQITYFYDMEYENPHGQPVFTHKEITEGAQDEKDSLSIKLNKTH